MEVTPDKRHNKTFIRSKDIKGVNDILTSMNIKNANKTSGQYLSLKYLLVGNEKATFIARYNKKYKKESNIIEVFTGCLLTNFKYLYK